MNKRDFNWRNSHSPSNNSNTPFNAVVTTDRPNAGNTDELGKPQAGTLVQLPNHLFVPAGAQSLDLRKVANIAANTTNPFELFSFECPRGARTHFLSYGVFSDGTLAADQEFIPRVNNSRIFPYHGDPTDNFKINLGLAPDLSNSSLIQCQLTLEPGQTVKWFVKNLSATVAIAMGVRMVGYVDTSQTRNTVRFGG